VGASINRIGRRIFILILPKEKYFILHYASGALLAYSLPSGTTTKEQRHKNSGKPGAARSKHGAAA
jgi:hypothetical protein